MIGEISQRSTLRLAMWVPTVGLGVAALAMIAATTSFAADHLRARGAAPA